MRGVMGPQAWGLLVLGVLIACGHLIEGSEYYEGGFEGFSVRCTIGVQHPLTRPPGGEFKACNVLKAGLPRVFGEKCQPVNQINQGYYTLYEVVVVVVGRGDSDYYSSQELLGNFDVIEAERAAAGGKFVPGTLEFLDLNECKHRTIECSPNAGCKDEWATYTCECLDGYRDNSGSGRRRGSRCDKDEVPPATGVDLQVWVYVLIAIAIFVVLMLVVCCCCCYTGSTDCVPGMQQARTKVIKHIKVIPQQPPAAPPPCLCKPPEEKKIVIQVDQTPAPAPAPVQIDPILSGPSAFIANSGYDGKVYVGSGQPVQATRALPWADGCSIQTVNPAVQTVQYVQQQEPQQVQYVQQQEPQQVQYVQQQPAYVQQVTTPYVYNVDVDQSDLQTMYATYQ